MSHPVKIAEEWCRKQDIQAFVGCCRKDEAFEIVDLFSGPHTLNEAEAIYDALKWNNTTNFYVITASK